MHKFAALVYGLALIAQAASALAAEAPLPAWVKRAIDDQVAGRSRPMIIEVCSYNGKRAFQFGRNDADDANDEFTLFDETGKQICQFGGYAGHVTSGSCDLERIACDRRLYPTK